MIRSNKMIKRLAALLLALTVLALSGCVQNYTYPDGELTVSFLDVGQGDSAFIRFPDGETMLIDASEDEYSDDVIKFIKRRGHGRIDYVVATHPHTDHIGGMADVINEFEVGQVYMPNASSSTVTFERLLSVIESKNIDVFEAVKGAEIKSGKGLGVEVISPDSKGDYDDNNVSAVIMLTFGEKKFLFMGDAEKYAEGRLSGDLSCDVVKVGHHGSDTSSSEGFVMKTRPEYAVISVGMGNKYSHPDSGVIKRWEKYGATVIRTDLSGDITFTTDGKTISVSVQKGDVSENTETPPISEIKQAWVLNISTKKIHTPDCRYAKDLKPENKQESEESLDELIKKGYEKCKTCDPS